MAALALALAFPAVALGDAYDGHRCPHHDAVPEASTAPVGHGNHGTAEEAAPSPHQHGPEHGGPCNCIGQCVTQVGVALPSLEPARSAAVAPPGTAPIYLTATECVAAEPSYLLPFSNAPPSLDRS